MSVDGNKRGKSRVALCLGIVILAGWLVYAAIFIYRTEKGGGRTLSPEVRQLLREELQEEWFSIYQHGRRAGYSHTEVQPQGDGYALTDASTTSRGYAQRG